MSRERGASYERQAERYLRRACGFRIVSRNYVCCGGELDLVALDKRSLVFVEVRARSSDRWGRAEATVDARKQARIARAAQSYLVRRAGCLRFVDCRFDVVGFTAGQLLHIRDAFRIGI